MSTRSHWEQIYTCTSSDRLGWHQEHLVQSLELIAQVSLPISASVLDVGGGDSTLVDDLLRMGYFRVAVLDISAAALERAKARLGKAGRLVEWIEGDVTSVTLPAEHFDLWHDRALFHFLTGPEARRAYLTTLDRSLRSRGYAVIATFAENGPEQCSGLPTNRYSSGLLQAELGDRFELIDSRLETHKKPQGGEQEFLYSLFRKD